MRRTPLPFAILVGVAFHHSGWTKGSEKMTGLTTEWVKVMVAALTTAGLVVHTLGG